MATPKNLNPRLRMNPNFKTAYNKDQDPWEELENKLESATNGEEKVTYEVTEARKNGKLFLSGMSMTTLPAAMFDIRNDLLDKKSDDEDDQNELKSYEKPWQCYGEEMLTLVDISDNDLSNIKSLERISCFKSLISFHIRNCKLPSLPWEVFKSNMPSLKHLDAPGNNFQEVPVHLLPESITTLNFASNRIKSLGDDMTCDVLLPNLTKLDLENNKDLFRLPMKLFTPSLQHANFAKNSLETISNDFLLSCKLSLQTLRLNENQLTLPLNLIQHSELKILELRYNQLRKVPRLHENLVKFDIFHNKISSIEGMYPCLEACNEYGRSEDGGWFRPKLKDFFLGDNNLSELHSQTMAVMTKLSFIDLSNNALETIPSVVGYLRDLNKVNVDGNPFRIIRSAITYRPQGGIDTEKLMRSLRNKGYAPKGPGYHADAGWFVEASSGVDEEATPQKVMEANILARQAVDGRRSLDLNGRGLSDELKWPELMKALAQENEESTLGKKVSILNIADGKITKFGDEWVETLPSIIKLEGQRNCLESLPSKFTQLPLKAILLRRNNISSQVFENNICVTGTTLSSTLMELDLSTNRLEWIPDSLFDLTNLRTLNLSQNSMKTLAWEKDKASGKDRGWRHGLTSLEYLNLSDNKLKNLGYLPLALYGCKKLRTLMLNNNCIYDIPLEIGLLDQLTSIDLLGNSQRKIGMRVLTQSASNILKYLRERMDKDQIAQARNSHCEIMEALKEEYNVELDGDVLQEQNTNNHKAHQTSQTEECVTSTHQINEQSEISPTSNNCNDDVINELKENICETELLLKNLSLSQAKRFALKKQLAMHRSKLIREERKKV